MKPAVPRPHALLGGLCAGVAAANVGRAPAAAGVVAAAVGAGALAARPPARVVLAATALIAFGWCWGSWRLATLDRSALAKLVGRAEQSVLVVTAPPRHGEFDVRVPVRVLRFGRIAPREPALLELPLGRSPPQGAILEAVATAAEPQGPAHGFDQRAWLRRQGVHVVLRASRWRLVGRRGGVGGLADGLRTWLGRGSTVGLHGERHALVAGVVLGDDQGLADGLRRDFRASGLYHLLAVSGQNVALVAAGTVLSLRLVGVSRRGGQIAAALAVLAYVAAVGPQPSVVRAGVAGLLGCLAWLTARERDRWYALLLGGLVLLGWNPYLLLDPGFQLSFAAVFSIFTFAPRLRRWLDGYPVPDCIAEVAAISAACGLATAPIAWLQFHSVPLLTIPANLAAAPAVAPLLGLALAAAVTTPLAPSAASVLAWAAGWCAAYVATCARVVAALPFAQINSGRGVAALAGFVLLCASYACRRGERAEAGLPPHRQRPTENPHRARAASDAVRR